jgi:2-keto-4-pentenoate hydratase
MSPDSQAKHEAGRSLTRGLTAQRLAFQRALASGMPRAGWKIGLNVPDVQARFGLDGPLVGWLDGHRVIASGAEYAAREGCRPHVEAELALRLGAPVRADASPDEARGAIGAVSPALELVDYARARADLEAAVALVAQRLAEVGETLQAGDLILSGSYTIPLPLAPGETVTADFGALGRVSVTLAR